MPIKPGLDTWPDRPVDNRPMASAPMKYLPDGQVDWGNMWETFCALAKDGGPPHRGTLLRAEPDADPDSPGYQAVAAEIGRGIKAVSGLEARPAEAGWIAVTCGSPSMARWLSEAINEENVQAHAEGKTLFVPSGENYTVKGEIKNVITAVAKTTHYWQLHLPAETKQAVALELLFGRVLQGVARLRRQTPFRFLSKRSYNGRASTIIDATTGS